MDGSYAGYGPASWAYQAAHAVLNMAPGQQQPQQLYTDPLSLQQLQAPPSPGPSPYDPNYATMPYVNPAMMAPPGAPLAGAFADPAAYGGAYSGALSYNEGADWYPAGPYAGADGVQDAYMYGGAGEFAGGGGVTAAPHSAAASSNSSSGRAGGAAGGAHSIAGGSSTRGGQNAMSAPRAITATVTRQQQDNPSSAAPASIPAYVGRVKEAGLLSRLAVEQLARCAPVWVVYYNYTLNGPTGQPGVLTSDQLVQAYGSRRVQGHTMLVGLAAGARQVLPTPRAGEPLVPPVFLRPLVFYLALAHARFPYMPITGEQLTSGLPPPGWCLAGSLFAPCSGSATPAATAAAASSSRPRGALASWEPLAVDAAVRALLDRAPYWCLLNTYADTGRWNCPQNLSAQQVMEKLRAGHGCLHACLLGTSERLPGGLWIPTSMVLPLGVLLQTQGSDPELKYTPPTAADVRYFIEDAVRAVRGRPEVEARLAAHLRSVQQEAGGAAAEASGAEGGEEKGVNLPARLSPAAVAFVPLSQAGGLELGGKGNGCQGQEGGADAGQGAGQRVEGDEATASMVAVDGGAAAASSAAAETRPEPQQTDAQGGAPEGSGPSGTQETGGKEPAGGDAARAETPPGQASDVAATRTNVADAAGAGGAGQTTASAATEELAVPTPVPVPAAAAAAKPPAPSVRKPTYAQAAAAVTEGDAAAGAGSSSAGSGEVPSGGGGRAAMAQHPRGPEPHQQPGTHPVNHHHHQQQQQQQQQQHHHQYGSGAGSGTSVEGANKQQRLHGQGSPKQKHHPELTQQELQQGWVQRGSLQVPIPVPITLPQAAGGSSGGQAQTRRGGSPAVPTPVPTPVPVVNLSLQQQQHLHQQQHHLQQQQQQQAHQQQAHQQQLMKQQHHHQQQQQSQVGAYQAAQQQQQSQVGAYQAAQQQQQAQVGAYQAAQQQQQQQAQPGGVLVPIPTPFVRFETAVFRLFQGDHGQHAFSSLWWYLDPASSTTAAAASGSSRGGPHVLGPYSCEQMILAYIAQLLPHDAKVCGTQGTLAPPSAPPPAAFLPLGTLLAATEEGQPYTLMQVAPELPKPLGLTAASAASSSHTQKQHQSQQQPQQQYLTQQVAGEAVPPVPPHLLPAMLAAAAAARTGQHQHGGVGPGSGRAGVPR